MLHRSVTKFSLINFEVNIILHVSYNKDNKDMIYQKDRISSSLEK